MRTIYLDVLLIFDLYMSYLLLRLTARIMHSRLPFRRALLGAALGSISSLLVLLPPIPFLLSLLLKLAAALVTVLGAFGFRNRTLFLRHCICFLGVSCVLAGILLALTSTGNVYYTNGVWYPVISLRLLVIFTMLAYLLLHLFSRIRSRFAADGCYEVCIRYGAHTVRLSGLADTGNTLTDFLTGKRVIICSRESLEEMLPQTLPCRGFRPLPYCTVAGEGVLFVFTPDETVIRRDDLCKPVDVLIGVDDQSHKQAIFHPSLI